MGEDFLISPPVREPLVCNSHCQRRERERVAEREKERGKERQRVDGGREREFC